VAFDCGVPAVTVVNGGHSGTADYGGVDENIGYSVDIERSGGWFDNAPEVREAPLRVTHLSAGKKCLPDCSPAADFLQPRQEPR
jgi:hypothetical protein